MWLARRTGNWQFALHLDGRARLNEVAHIVETTAEDVSDCNNDSWAPAWDGGAKAGRVLLATRALWQEAWLQRFVRKCIRIF